MRERERNRERGRAGRGRRERRRGERKSRKALRKKAGSINDINQQILRPPDWRCAADTRAEEQPLTRCLASLSLPRRRAPRRTDRCLRYFIRGGWGERHAPAMRACIPQQKAELCPPRLLSLVDLHPSPLFAENASSCSRHPAP